MIKKVKRNIVVDTEEVTAKKVKKSLKNTESNHEKHGDKKPKIVAFQKPEKSSSDGDKKHIKSKLTSKGKLKSFSKDKKKKLEKPEDWNEFKKKKKELQVKRKQTKNLYEITVQAKKIGENLRRKTLKKGLEERNGMTVELHGLLGGQKNYPKFVLTHDMARIVQYMLKFSSEKIRREIAKELIPVTSEMLQSKYAKFCVKHMLKYGNAETRIEVMKACYGKAVKLSSHAVSALVFDYGYTTWATPLIKQHLVQEFYGDMYKQSKDDSIKHIRDTYSKSPDMKTAVLGAMKANLARILNKKLLDSHLVQTAIMQFLQECNLEDRSEIISQLASHLVVLSNSKEGAKAAMLCYWYGTNKDRKTSMKALKEHVLDLCKHEHAHNTIIAILDSADDTVLLNKLLLGEIVSHSLDLVANEWGRRVLFWLVAPGEKTHFHPTFVSELNHGKENSVSKKDTTVRRSEILNYVVGPLLKKISADPGKWLASSSIAVATLAIVKAGSGKELEMVFENIAREISNPDWQIVEGETTTPGVDHAGLHMILKKLIQNDKDVIDRPTFTAALVDFLSEKSIRKWIKSKSGCNRACFLLVNTFESGSEEVQNKLRNTFSKELVELAEQAKCKGAEILLQKIKT